MIGHFFFCLFAAKSYKLAKRHCIKYCNWPSFGSSLLHMHYQSPILAAIQLKYCQVFVCMAVSVVLSSPCVLSMDTTLWGIKSVRKHRLHTRTLQLVLTMPDNSQTLLCNKHSDEFRLIMRLYSNLVIRLLLPLHTGPTLPSYPILLGHGRGPAAALAAHKRIKIHKAPALLLCVDLNIRLITVIMTNWNKTAKLKLDKSTLSPCSYHFS